MAIFVPTAMIIKRSKVSPIYYLRLLLLLIGLTILTLQSYSSDISEERFRHFLTSQQDTIPVAGKDTASLAKDSLTKRSTKDTLIKKTDTLNTVSYTHLTLPTILRV